MLIEYRIGNWTQFMKYINKKLVNLIQKNSLNCSKVKHIIINGQIKIKYFHFA